jgi:ATP-dependent protease ClpP protease subunit
MSSIHDSLIYGATADWLARLAHSAPAGRPLKQSAFRSAMFTQMAQQPEVAWHTYGQLAPLEDNPPHAGDIAERSARANQVPSAPLPASEWSYQTSDAELILQINSELAFGLHDVPGTLAKIREAKSVRLFINSTGGDIALALDFWLALQGKVIEATAHGKVWSAATVLWQCAPVRRVTADTTIMVHGGCIAVLGTASDLRRAADRLEQSNHCWKEAYLWTPPAIVNGWIDDGRDHWLTPQQALETGLATEIIPESHTF